MANLAEQYGFRDDLVDELINDLVGPAEGPGEVITDPPLDRYVSGVLWPADDFLQEAAEPDSGEPEENDAGENPISQALMRYPTSMGITFSVDLARATSVQIAVDAAKYVPSGTGNTSESVDAERSSRRQRTRRPDSWVREQQVVDPIDWDVATPGAKKVDVVPGLQLYVYSRTPKDGRVAVSVALRNMQVTPKGELRDGFAWFQVGLEVRSVERAIVDRSSYGVLSADADLRSAALLYRNARVFAIGALAVRADVYGWLRVGPVYPRLELPDVSFYPFSPGTSPTWQVRSILASMARIAASALARGRLRPVRRAWRMLAVVYP